MRKIITFSSDALLEEWVARFWMTYSGNATLENDQITYSDGSTVHLVSAQNLEAASAKVAGRTYDEGEYHGKLTLEIATWMDEVVLPAKGKSQNPQKSYCISQKSVYLLEVMMASLEAAKPYGFVDAKWVSHSIGLILSTLKEIK